jgi:hypothetical protein
MENQFITEAKRMQKLAGIINEFDIDRFSPFKRDNPSSSKSSFEGKWVDIDDKNEFKTKFSINSSSPLVDIVSRAIGSKENYAITNKGGKYYVYAFQKTAEPGKSSQPFNSLDDAKKSIKLN